MEEIKWNIDELLARYHLEPELRDVFVEGSFDREILSHYSQFNTSGRVFYEINTVDVPAQLLEIYGFTSGNKQRAIALSNEFAKLPTAAQVFCLVDRDLDHWFDKVENSDRLRWSFFCSIECHYLCADVIRDVAIITGGAKIANFESFVSSLCSVLRQLYALRLADRELGLNIKWVSLRKYLTSNLSAISFDFQKYTLAVLNANSATKQKNEFIKKTDVWRQKLVCDVRLTCRGHDYTELLAWAISEFKGLREFSNESAIERLFILLARNISSLAYEVQ